MKKHFSTRAVRSIGWILFIFYLAGLTYFMFFSESLGRTDLSVGYRYNLEPFREIYRCIRYWDVLGPLNASMNLIGNIVAFMPFGFILPMLCLSNRRWYIVFLLGLLCSLCIESLQLVTRRGSFDVDDLMLNTLGSLAGYWCFLIAARFRRQLHKKR
ncbi:VanZ family protein [Qiania dongpingensis]|nr:VanZ family protein [Qiania dongpingensis]